MALHCPECGFVNTDGANYCARCGAFLAPTDSGTGGPATATYRVGETGELEAIDLDAVVAQGAVLVIRSGGGRTGETFPVEGERITVGRRPDSDIFLDDVTVSRDHALLVKRGDGWFIDDLGSLNGTYVNRQRIESHRLNDGDELQIGKYKLAYLSR
jgi:pSer/pThr/pTyr-binding forkhead associated (FHA) protein